MGFALTLIYIVITILSPNQFGQDFADYHPMVYLAAVTSIASLPSIFANAQMRSSIQTRLVFGFIATIALSEIANGWFGGAIAALRDILPGAAIFFFIVTNVTTTRRLKITILVAVGTCLALSLEALSGYYGHFHRDLFVLFGDGQLQRLRAAGTLNDPNDFAQMLLIALSLTFAAWNGRRVALNSLIVFVPSALLLWAIYLTHSRGALIALGVLILMMSRRKIGSLPSVALAGCLVFGMMALNFTGGRGISSADGSDRLELWSEGLQLFKRAPLFGVGFGRFTEFSDLTAHNSFVLCLAELGLVGSTIFVALLVTTLMGLKESIESQEEVGGQPTALPENTAEERSTASEGEPLSPEVESDIAAGIWSDVGTDIAVEVSGDPEKIGMNQLLAPMRLAVISFIVTGFFLSRSYNITMFLAVGLATAAIALAPHALRFRDGRRWRRATLIAELSAIAFVYCIARFRH